MDPSRTDREGVDPTLAERLRRSADDRIAEQIEAVRRRTAEQQATRTAFAQSRSAGLRNRLAAKRARLRLTEHHTQKGQP